MPKNSVFQAASFGDLLLNEKQKEPFVSLNNEVAQALCMLIIENFSMFKGKCLSNSYFIIEVKVTIMLIIYMKKLLDSDWLRAVQFKCNTSAKSVTPVQKV